MKKLWLLLPISLLAAMCVHAATPDMATIQKLEANIKPGDIPKWYNGHVPVAAEYARYYTTGTKNGKHVLIGEWVVPDDPKEKKPGIYPVATSAQFPIVFDGGCGIVNIIYDIDANRILSLKCNGYA